MILSIVVNLYGASFSIRYLVGCALAAGVLAVVPVSAQVQIKLNQLGFYPDGPKYAVAVGSATDTFMVVRQSDGATVFSGMLGAGQNWSASGENARIADFSTFRNSGIYMVRCAGCSDSYPFSIDGTIHLDVTRGAIKSYYFNRCSFELTEPFAGRYARKAGHPDTAVQIHPGAETAARPAGTKIIAPGGWYDAGDYGKYIVNSGISTYTLFAAYEAFPAFYDTLVLDIPESANNIPDLLDEALFNLRWMLTMQDPDDGGVYHKLTTADFSEMVMPDADTAVRYVVAKSTTATLDFAAVCAQAARIFRKFESNLPGFSDSCLNASLYAWQWARVNPKVFYRNANTANPGVTTGEYGDGNPSDEFLWAATELFIATKQDSFFTVAFPDGKLSGVNKVPGWPSVGALGLYSLFLCKDTFAEVSPEQITAAIAALADSTMQIVAENPYHIGMRERDFGWGSNSAAANRGVSLLLGYLGTKKEEYKAAAVDQLDYLLGRNPTGYSYVTGFGDKVPMFIHHRPSIADAVEAPVPGFLAGGPNPAMQDAVACDGDTYPSSLPAVAYLDKACSYASNEIAINWNAPLVFLAGGIEELYGNKAAGTVTPHGKKKAVTAGTLRQRAGFIEVVLPAGNTAVVTVMSLAGKVIFSQYCPGTVRIAEKWPMQVVVVQVRNRGAAGGGLRQSGVLFSGSR